MGHLCGCCATKHALVNNCLGCGRIVCTQEGAGPCLFCGYLVVTPEQQEILERGSKKSEQLVGKILKERESLIRARAQKDKLLEYQSSASPSE